jgi:predicted PurR-regulated permease PerM
MADLQQDLVKKIIGLSIFILLLVFSFFLIRPYLTAVLTAIIFAYVLRPIYVKLNKKINNANVTAGIISVVLVVLFIVLLFFVAQITIKEVIGFYSYTQTHDIAAPLKNIIQQISQDKDFVEQIGKLIDLGIEKGAKFLVNFVNDLIVNLPYLLMQLFVMFFVMFFFLRDADSIVEYLKSLLPFKESVREKFFIRFRSITNGIIYGVVLIGAIQGVLTGIGLWIFGIDQAFLLTVVATIAAILPYLGAWVVWLPAAISLVIQGNVTNGLILLLYGLVVVSLIDNFLRPYVIGKKTDINLVVVLLGMLGGLEIFGIIGLIIGPLIIDYLLIFIEFYRTQQLKELI